MVYRFFDVCRSVEEDPDLGEGDDGHHQRVVPHLVLVWVDIRHWGLISKTSRDVRLTVLEAAFLGLREIVHDPFRPLVAPPSPAGIIRTPVREETREGVERGHGIDVLRRTITVGDFVLCLEPSQRGTTRILDRSGRMGTLDVL